jgi:hypothetical protein
MAGGMDAHQGERMMNIGTIRLGLSLILAAGWWVQQLPAQTPTAPVPTAPVQVQPAQPVGQPIDSDVAPKRKSFILRLFNNHGYGCYSTVGDCGCGSTASELTFIFGSCRAFFGEPCGTPPPHAPRP